MLLPVFFSCTEALSESREQEIAVVPETKAINSAEDALEGSLLVFLDDEAVSHELGERFLASGVKSWRRLFPSVPGKEERERRFGLDRWWVLETDSPVVDLASRIAGEAPVRKIQFNTSLRKGSDGSHFPLNPDALTKAPAKGYFDDPELPMQWHFKNTGDIGIAVTAKAGGDINVEEAWKICTGDPSVVVAIVDEGICLTHPDLKDNLWTNPKEIANGIDDDGNGYVDDIHGYNFPKKSSTITWSEKNPDDPRKDDSGHGSHVAGIISAVNNNGKGVCGIAGGSGKGDGVRLMSCQVFAASSQSSGSAGVLAEAIKYAADNGASIVQASLGYTSGMFTSDRDYDRYTGVEVSALKYFMDTSNNDALDGGIVIFAAGNDSKPLPGYPGAYRDNICVTAFASDFLPAHYTNYGPGSNVAAPGGEYYTGGKFSSNGAILSTLPPEIETSGYGYMQGTSMACPHATGVAALGLSYMLQRNRKYTISEFKAMFLTSVSDMDKWIYGTKQTIVGSSIGSLNLSPYKANMGTGAIDAYRFLLQVEGTPYRQAVVGEENALTLADYFGASFNQLTYLSVEISDEDKAALGITSYPFIRSGRLLITPTKAGCGKVTIHAVGGGTTIGTEDVVGGMHITKTVAIIARGASSSNGGWL